VWDWLVWSALAAAILAVVAAIVRLGVVLLRAYRDFKRSRRALFKELDRVADAAESVASRAEALGAGSERLTHSVERLAVSRRRLNVLRAAIDEATDAAGWVTAVYPRK
jgi:hypothetical protein